MYIFTKLEQRLELGLGSKLGLGSRARVKARARIKARARDLGIGVVLEKYPIKKQNNNNINRASIEEYNYEYIQKCSIHKHVEEFIVPM